MKLKILLSLVISYALFSCNRENSSSNDMYFGGLIINPTSKFVVLLKKDVIIDTFYLDKKNQFGGKLVNGEKGLYVFKHPPENQIIYLEPGDSTLILINTLDFDESLNFSGRGAAKSNFLNSMYLQNQQNNDLVASYYQLSPSKFAAKSDSIRSLRQQKLRLLDDRHQFSSEFYELANATINYEFYDLRERYAYLIRKYSREYIDDIPKDFHNYREEISFNDEKLEDYYVYVNLLDDLLRTKSLEYCEEKKIENFACYNLTDFSNIKRRIILADSLISSNRVKYSFIDRLAAQGIIYSQTTEDIKDILNLLTEIDYSGSRLNDLKQMAAIQNNLLPGNNIGHLKLLNTQKDTVTLNQLSSRPKITYHWSINYQEHHKWQHEIVKNLRIKYPEADFIGVNIDKNKFTEWNDVINNQSYNPAYEFKLNSLKVKEDLLENYLNKLIFLDPSGEIIRGDTQINSLDYETKILEFLSK